MQKAALENEKKLLAQESPLIVRESQAWSGVSPFNEFLINYFQLTTTRIINDDFLYDNRAPNRETWLDRQNHRNSWVMNIRKQSHGILGMQTQKAILGSKNNPKTIKN